MPAEYAAFQLDGEPWYGYWYGVILQVVEGALVFRQREQGFLGVTLLRQLPLIACQSLLLDFQITAIPMATIRMIGGPSTRASLRGWY